MPKTVAPTKPARKPHVKRFIKQSCDHCGGDVRFDLRLMRDCAICGAKAGEPCKDLRAKNGKSGVRLSPHPERMA